MNLAQLIDPEWVQQGCPPRYAPVRPAGALPPMGVVSRTADGLPGVGPSRFAYVRPPAAVERAAAVRAPVQEAPAAPAPRGRGADARRVTAEKPWPRGKEGNRYELLKILGDSYIKLGVVACHARLLKAQPKSNVKQNMVGLILRDLVAQSLAERSGERKHYLWVITPEGRKALEWKA